MARLKNCLVVAFISTTIIVLLFGLASASSWASSNPVSGFDVVFHSEYSQGVYEGEDFPLGIFSIPTGFNGTVHLTVDNGTITPSTVTITNGSWIGRVAVTGTNLAVITVSDLQGHTGKSYPLNIYTATPTPAPSSTDSAPNNGPAPRPLIPTLDLLQP